MERTRQKPLDERFLASLGARIRALRRHHRMRQRELGRRIGRSKYTVYRYERGEHAPDLQTLIRLRRELRVTLDYLVTGTRSGHTGDARLLAVFQEIEQLRPERCDELIRLVEALLHEFALQPAPPDRLADHPTGGAPLGETLGLVVVDEAFRRAMGDRIRALRSHHRLTQAELARRIGCKESTIHRYEHGVYCPGLLALLRLRRELRASLDYLLLGLGPLRDTRLLAALRTIEHLPQDRRAELARLLDACLSGSTPATLTAPAVPPPAPLLQFPVSARGSHGTS